MMRVAHPCQQSSAANKIANLSDRFACLFPQPGQDLNLDGITTVQIPSSSQRFNSCMSDFNLFLYTLFSSSIRVLLLSLWHLSWRPHCPTLVCFFYRVAQKAISDAMYAALKQLWTFPWLVVLEGIVPVPFVGHQYLPLLQLQRPSSLFDAASRPLHANFFVIKRVPFQSFPATRYGNERTKRTRMEAWAAKLGKGGWAI